MQSQASSERLLTCEHPLRENGFPSLQFNPCFLHFAKGIVNVGAAKVGQRPQTHFVSESVRQWKVYATILHIHQEGKIEYLTVRETNRQLTSNCLGNGARIYSPFRQPCRCRPRADG